MVSQDYSLAEMADANTNTKGVTRSCASKPKNLDLNPGARLIINFSSTKLVMDNAGKVGFLLESSANQIYNKGSKLEVQSERLLWVQHASKRSM